MTWAKATLCFLTFVLALVALGLYALYQVSTVGFGVALGALATMILGTFFMLAVAVAVRVINGGGRRQPMQVDALAAAPAQWQMAPPQPPMISTNYHPVLGDTRAPLPAQSVEALRLNAPVALEEWD